MTIPRLFEIQHKVFIDLNKVVMVDGPWRDSRGSPLGEGFYKVFLEGNYTLDINDYNLSYTKFMKAWSNQKYI